jgi:hypothetical protein
MDTVFDTIAFMDFIERKLPHGKDGNTIYPAVIMGGGVYKFKVLFNGVYVDLFVGCVNNIGWVVG